MASLILTSDLALGKAVGLQASHRHRFHNGRLALHCLQFDLHDTNHSGRLISRQPRALNRLAKKLSPKGKRWLPIVCAESSASSSMARARGGNLFSSL